MIKIEELKVCATINRAASVKKDKKGASYLSLQARGTCQN